MINPKGDTLDIDLDHRTDDEFFEDFRDKYDIEVWDYRYSYGVWKVLTISITWVFTFFISVASFFYFDLHFLWLSVLTFIGFLSIIPIVAFYALVSTLVSTLVGGFKVREDGYENNYWRVRLSNDFDSELFKKKVIKPLRGSNHIGNIGLGDDNLERFINMVKGFMNTPIQLNNGYCTRLYELYTVNKKGDKLVLTTNDFKLISDGSYDLELITTPELDLEGLYNWYVGIKKSAKNINELFLLRKEVEEIKESENRLKEEHITRNRERNEKIKYIEDNIEKQKKLREESKEYMGITNIQKLIEEEKVYIEKDKEELVKRLGENV